MTRAEVQENIRYNERLLTQYQNQVNDIQHKIHSLESQASSLYSQKSGYISDINKLEKQIDELNQLKRKYQTLQDDFYSRQAKRLNRLGTIDSQNLKVKFINSYVDGMKLLLSGSEYKAAYNNLTESKEIIAKEINSIQRRIDNLKNTVVSVEREIDSKQNSINSYRSQRSTAESNLSYRKQRITYWRKQLRFATN